MQEFQEGASSYTLQEVCAECEVPSHVLVYWSDFFEVLKGQDGHLKSVFSPEELALIRKVKKCLYSQCMTVVEAKKALAEDVRAIARAKDEPQEDVTPEAASQAPVVPETEPDSVDVAPAETLASVEPQTPTASEMPVDDEGEKTPALAQEATSEVPQTPQVMSLADVLEGNLSELEAAVATQKNRFEERLSEQRCEFSAVESECAARVSDLSSDLTEALEKTRRLEELLAQTLKDLEAFRLAAFGDK